jgi:transposase InsO family protein
LVVREINVIKAYCADILYLHWPLASIYHQIRREGAACFTLSTFYKYVSLLGLKRRLARHRRKNHHAGIRAHAPLQILHADATVFRTADNRQSYIHLVQDNYSRTILGYTATESCKGENTFANLDAVLQKYLIPSGIASCMLLTDDGSENAGSLKNLITGTAFPTITHLIAQRDIEFSNSMIEAVNKQLKYRFLYHHSIADHAALVKYLEQAVEDYNSRPHDVLNGLTPLEVMEGKVFDKDAWQQQMLFARTNRIAENKKNKCCYYSF